MTVYKFEYFSIESVYKFNNVDELPKIMYIQLYCWYFIFV